MQSCAMVAQYCAMHIECCAILRKSFEFCAMSCNGCANVKFVQVFALLRNIVQWLRNVICAYLVLRYNAQWFRNVANHCENF